MIDSVFLFSEGKHCEFFQIFSLLFSYVQFCSLFSSSTHFSILLALVVFLSWAEGFLPNRFSWLNKSLERNSLLASLS